MSLIKKAAPGFSLCAGAAKPNSPCELGGTRPPTKFYVHSGGGTMFLDGVEHGSCSAGDIVDETGTVGAYSASAGGEGVEWTSINNNAGVTNDINIIVSDGSDYVFTAEEGQIIVSLSDALLVNGKKVVKNKWARPTVGVQYVVAAPSGDAWAIVKQIT